MLAELTYEPAQEPAVHTSDELPVDLDELYQQALLLTGTNALSLRALGLLCWEHRKFPRRIKFLTGQIGRNAKHLVAAVVRFPEYFMAVGDKPVVDGSTDEYLSLFLIAKLAVRDSKAIFERMRNYTLSYWQVRDLVEQAQELARAAEGQPVRLRLKDVKVTAASALPVSGKLENSLTLTWNGGELLDPTFWHGQTVQGEIRFRETLEAAGAAADTDSEPGAE